MKEWVWFKICLFSKYKIDLVEELKFLNSLLARHNLLEYEKFSSCIDNSIVPENPLVFLSKREEKNRTK